MKRNTLIRIIILILLFVVLICIGKYSPLRDYFTPDKFLETVRNAGHLGLFIYLTLFCIGLLLYIPGVLFIFFATLLYNPIEALFISYSAGLIAVTINFYIVRLIGGQVLGEIKNPLMKRILKNINSKPIQTMFVLRLFFWLSPLLNSTLALSRVKQSQFHIGNIIGLIIPIVGFTFGFHYFQTLFIEFFIK